MSKRRRASLEDEVTVTCPHCSERQLLVVDPETSGVMIQDCDVCCRPWTVEVSRSSDGELEVVVTRA